MRRIAVILAAAALVSGCQSVRDNLTRQQPNPGPCPTALSLHEAHRLVEFTGQDITFSNVGFTAEILNVTSTCRYTDERADPISMSMEIRMAFGRGPAATGSQKTYEYFIATTRRDSVVLDKQTFTIPVTFPSGQNRVEVVERIETISIPRATPTTSGGNFEVLTGFVLTPEQIEYNRSGQRFRVDVDGREAQ